MALARHKPEGGAPFRCITVALPFHIRSISVTRELHIRYKRHLASATFPQPQAHDRAALACA